MIVYNVTIKVNELIKEEWLTWLKKEHIPEIIATGCFEQAVILSLLEVDDAEGPTFTIQYQAPSKAMYNLYIENFSAKMKQKSFDRWGDNFIAFRSVMQIVN